MLEGGWDKSPSLSIVFRLSSKTQWLSGLYYADFISFYSPTQLCGSGTTKSNSNELPISVPLSFIYLVSESGSILIGIILLLVLCFPADWKWVRKWEKIFMSSDAAISLLWRIKLKISGASWSRIIRTWLAKSWKTDGLGRKALPLLLERQNYTIIVGVE